MKSQAEAAQKTALAHAIVLTKHFESQTDLFTTCRLCKARVTGTLQQIKDHATGCGLLWNQSSNDRS